jgi:hypothetical protein
MYVIASVDTLPIRMHVFSRRKLCPDLPLQSLYVLGEVADAL